VTDAILKNAPLLLIPLCGGWFYLVSTTVDLSPGSWGIIGSIVGLAIAARWTVTIGEPRIAPRDSERDRE